MKFRFATCQHLTDILVVYITDPFRMYIFTSVSPAYSSTIRMIINELKGDELSRTRAIRCARLGGETQCRGT